MITELINWCGPVCETLAGRNPITFSIVGLGIVTLIYLRLRRIDKYVKAMHQEALELKRLAQFPNCSECAYRDICPKRIEAIKIEECS